MDAIIDFIGAVIGWAIVVFILLAAIGTVIWGFKNNVN